MNRIDDTDLEVFPLCFGGNVFGWTVDEAGSFALLDAYTAAGGNFIDTADSYVEWAPGGQGGESETIIGRWLARRGRRDDLVIATKVGQAPGREGLSPANVAAAADASLARLGTDHIDLYYAHEDDPDTPLEETLAAFAELVRAGKVRHVAASNYTAPRLAQALATSDRIGAPRYVAMQTHYNLVHRDEYEAELAPLCAREQLSGLAYSALADGFLTGKYRPGRELPQSERAEDAAPYLDGRGGRVLEALDSVAARHEAPVAAVALAWLTAQPTVAAAVASARTVDQLRELLVSATLRLGDDDVRLLGDASAAA
ncbi:MAG TPA: aldo/keto reductase [Gaiellales bacterium]|jgi:aryl-alcohol dehydrogenase-like predicted oxidoreductase|nr:aldo/keto reductase [Gaiellales bacterium]